MTKNLVDNLTNEEICEIIKIVEKDPLLCQMYRIKKRNKEKIVLKDSIGGKITIYNNKITSANKAILMNTEFPIEKSFQVAQYLIDRGYRFEYKK